MNIFLPYENDVKDNNYTVYMHIFPNNKKYIGITSMSVSDRWANGKGYKVSNFVRKAIDKYGWENIKHKILYEDLSKDDAENKEKELIAYYKSNNKMFGYNIQNGGNSKGKLSAIEIEKIRQRSKGNKIWLGKHHTEETKRKLREIHTGTKLSPETIEKIRLKNIGKKLSDSHKKALLMSNIGHHCSKEKAKKISLSMKTNKRVIQLLNNNIVDEYHNIASASRKTNIDSSSISRCCRGLQKTAGGYVWKNKDNYEYIKQNKPIKHILQFDLDSNFIKEYNSIQEICSSNKFYETHIRKCCRGLIKSAYGYIWRYKDECVSTI